jgi:tetratricopeptide (TPR) repeat protein
MKIRKILIAASVALGVAARFARYRFQPGKAAMELGELAALEKRTKEFPGRGIDLADLAVRYVNQARAQANRSFYDKAIAAARESLRLLPVSNAGAHVALAKVHEANHQFEQAVEEARAALKDSPDSVGAWSVLVTSRLARGEITDAAVAADRLVAIQPSPGHCALRGLTLLAQNREVEALHEFQRAVSLEESGGQGESAWIRSLLGRHWLAVDKLREAHWVLEEATRIFPESDFAHSLLSEAHLRRGDLAAAENASRRALELSPQPRYLRELARIRKARGDEKGAEGYLVEAERSVREELAESRQGHRLELVQILLERGGPERVQEAVKLAREETELRRSAETYYWLARAFAAADQAPFAVAAVEESLRRGERTPDRYRLLAELHRKLKNPSAAKLYDRLAHQ